MSNEEFDRIFNGVFKPDPTIDKIIELLEAGDYRMVRDGVTMGYFTSDQRIEAVRIIDGRDGNR